MAGGKENLFINDCLHTYAINVKTAKEEEWGGDAGRGDFIQKNIEK